MSGVKRPRKSKSTHIVAIDFGTSHTGAAYIHDGLETPIFFPPNYPVKNIDHEMIPRKVPTKLLLKVVADNRLELVGFGEDVTKKWKSTQSQDEGAGYLHFEDYKMKLSPHNRPEILNASLRSPATHGSLVATAHDGTNRDLEEILTFTFVAIKECLTKRLIHLHRTSKEPLNLQDVQWIFTVPNIWDEFAKDLMRSAAYKAGIASPESCEKLLFCLEPEAALVHWSHIKKSNLTTNDSLLVVDNGGGTNDITSHSVIHCKPLQFKSISIPSGGLWGSKMVDKRFLDFLKSLFDAYCDEPNSKLFEDFKQSPDICDLLHFGQGSWEAAKKEFNPSQEDYTSSVNFSSVLQFLGAKAKKYVQISELVDSFNRTQSFCLKSQGLYDMNFSNDHMRSFFTPLISKIVAATKDHLSAVERQMEQDPKPPAKGPAKKSLSIVMAGGFSDSEILLEQMESSFPGLVRRIENAQLAILDGAVRYGVAIETIASRNICRTYGIEVLQEFKPDDPLHQQIEREQPDLIRETLCRYGDGEGGIVVKKHVESIFQALKRKGEAISIFDDCRVETHSLPDGKSEVTFSLYSSDDHAPTRINERGMEKFATVTCACDEWKENVVEIVMKFGLAEMQIWAHNKTKRGRVGKTEFIGNKGRPYQNL